LEKQHQYLEMARKKIPVKKRRTAKRADKAPSKWRWVLLLLLLAAGSAVAWLHHNQVIQWPYWKTAPQQLGREIQNTAELQIALARSGFSSGSIDGLPGSQTRIALLAYQRRHQLPETGTLDPETAQQLFIQEPVFAQIELTQNDFNKIGPVPQSWRERGELPSMAYNSILEMVAEHSQSHPDYITQLNPQLNWNQLQPGTRIVVPLVPDYNIPSPIGYVRIQLSQRTLQAFDNQDRVIFHCPVSIARNVDKRPSGELSVKVRVQDPNYTFNPAILTAAAEREGITQKFIIPPGPNNPVGTVWIGLNLPSYGIHGTPVPEKVGRTESSGCFRLANWNAEMLLRVIQVGQRVLVEP